MKITAEDYLQKVGSTKDITLPSGAVFTIRKVQARELIGIEMPVTSKKEIGKKFTKEELAENWKKLKPKEQKAQIELCDTMIIIAVVSPVFTKETIVTIPGPGDSVDDYSSLFDAVMDFSYGRVGKVSPLSEIS